MSGSAAPIANDLWQPWFEGAADDRLVLPHCQTTQRAFWPPSLVSPFVTGGEVQWHEVRPMGLLTAQVTYRRGFLNAFKSLLPYGCGLVQLECGVRLQAHIAQPDDANAPATGSRVVLRFRSLIAGDPPVPCIEKAPT